MLFKLWVEILLQLFFRTHLNELFEKDPQKKLPILSGNQKNIFIEHGNIYVGDEKYKTINLS